MEGFLDKSKVVSVFGDLTLNQRGVVSKENSFLPSIINKSQNNGEKSFLSNSVLKSKLYTQHEVSKFFNIFLLFFDGKNIIKKKNEQHKHKKGS